MPHMPLVTMPELLERPKLDDKVTVRLPAELSAVVQAFALHNGTSVNEFILSSMENEIGRLFTYRLSLYAHLIPLMNDVQRIHCQTMLADLVPAPPSERV